MSYQPGPDDEILWLCERCHVNKGRLDEAVGRVTQEVPENACLGDRVALGGQADLGGVRGHVVGGIEVEVCDVPEPAWTQWKSEERGFETEQNFHVSRSFQRSYAGVITVALARRSGVPQTKAIVGLFLEGRKQ